MELRRDVYSSSFWTFSRDAAAADSRESGQTVQAIKSPVFILTVLLLLKTNGVSLGWGQTLMKAIFCRSDWRPTLHQSDLCCLLWRHISSGLTICLACFKPAFTSSSLNVPKTAKVNFEAIIQYYYFQELIKSERIRAGIQVINNSAHFFFIVFISLLSFLMFKKWKFMLVMEGLVSFCITTPNEPCIHL